MSTKRTTDTKRVASRNKKARGSIPLPESTLFGEKFSELTNLASLPLDSIRPDPNQARWLLPHDIRAKFIEGNLDAASALARWHKQVEKIRATAPEHPEVQKFNEIVSLANSIRANSQVNPITVVRQSDNTWRIETGERRYWAHVWLVHVGGDKTADRVPAAPQTNIDPFRQAAENLHAAPLNAVGTAREVARLLMASAPDGRWSQNGAETLTLDTYRKFASQRVPPGGWKRIESAMGHKSDHLARYLRLLLLPDEAIHLADRHEMTEKQLRPIAEMTDPKVQVRAVQLAANLKLSSTDIEFLCRHPDFRQAERELHERSAGQAAPTHGKAPRAKFAPDQIFFQRFQGFDRFAESLRRGGGDPAEALAEHLMAEKGLGDPVSKIGDMIRLLEDVRVRMVQRRGDAPVPSPGTESG